MTLYTKSGNLWLRIMLENRGFLSRSSEFSIGPNLLIKIKMTQLTELAEWQALKKHHQIINSQNMQTWFANDCLRFKHFSLQAGDLLLDYSKNRITQETIQLLCNLAKATHLSEKIANLFSGHYLNSTELRPALHTALRDRSQQSIYLNNKNIMPQIHAEQVKMRKFSDQVRQSQWLGATGKPITDIVNIGIGGSHLGPLMATHALQDFALDRLQCHFISTIDDAHVNEILKKINPETTLFIVSSKSFSTLETILNAKTIRAWLQDIVGSDRLFQHFVAVTSEPNKALEFGIPHEQIFLLWDWVGGRYSVWSAIGLPLAIMIGMDQFVNFLAGAFEMDKHFQQADFSTNMPVILALIGIWYNNFFDAKSHAIVPYTHQLNHFRAHLQQLDMESNGKRTTHFGQIIDYATGPIIWGEHGCNGQHAFHQLLHQGQHFVPVDFLIAVESNNELNDHHDLLIASCLSQAKALLQGKSYESALSELCEEGYSDEEAKTLASHKSIPGNRPSNILFLNKITPHSLGSLLALYEHKIFVQGAIWNINSFDQWGVELGKKLLPRILSDLKNTKKSSLSSYDSSTQGLIEHYQQIKSI